MNTLIRSLISGDEPFLWEMLYQALYVPIGSEPLPRDIIELPEISRYAKNWGDANDLGFIAIDEINGSPIGAVWIRLYYGENKGFGYIDDMTPEMSIAVLPGFRGCGVGSKLIAHLLNAVKSKFNAVSLSVSKDNPAARLYRRFGFETVESNGDSLVMIKRIGAVISL